MMRPGVRAASRAVLGRVGEALSFDRPPGSSAPKLAAPLLLAGLLALTFLTLPLPPMENDPDTSWGAVLNYARERGWQYGTDIVFTFGPLGYLITPYAWPGSLGIRLFTDTAMCYGVAASLCLVAWRLRAVWRWTLIAAVAFVLSNIQARMDLVLHVGLLSWGLLCFVESGRRLTLAVAGLAGLTVFVALAKVNFLFLGTFQIAVIATALWLDGSRRNATGLVAGAVAGFGAGWAATGQSMAQLGPMLARSLEMVQAYNSTQAKVGISTIRAYGISCAMLAALALAARVVLARPGGKPLSRGWRICLLGWAASLFFAVWKHGFLRGDPLHVVLFFGFVPVLALGLEALPGGMPVGWKWTRVFGAAASLLALGILQGTFFTALPTAVPKPFRTAAHSIRCLCRPSGYRAEVEKAYTTRRQEAAIPGLSGLVGRSTVDVSQHLQVYALLNGLHYTPRPVFQGYLATSPALMRLNESFYLGPGAPEYVLFRIRQNVFDRRFPPGEDALALRCLLMNYEPVAQEEPFLLLKRRSAKPAQLKLLKEGEARPGEKMDLRSFGATNLWVELDVKPSWLGRLCQFVYRPTHVRLAAWRLAPSQLLVRLRAPPPMPAAGFLASPLLLTNEDVLGLYTQCPVTRPDAYSVELEPGTAAFWQPSVRYRVYRFASPLVTPVSAETVKRFPPATPGKAG
jgi:hypothetical protein